MILISFSTHDCSTAVSLHERLDNQIFCLYQSLSFIVVFYLQNDRISYFDELCKDEPTRSTTDTYERAAFLSKNLHFKGRLVIKYVVEIFVYHVKCNPLYTVYSYIMLTKCMF